MLRFQKWARSSICDGCKRRNFAEYICGMIGERLAQGYALQELQGLINQAAEIQVEAMDVHGPEMWQ